MTASQPDNEAIFHAARDIPDPDRRREYVREACGGDAARIAQVEALLAAADGPDSLLDRPAAGAPVATIDHPATEGAGSVIGPYKLIEQIGEGGMGTVWMAQQTQPVKRLVAVKLIKAGMDSRQVIARFEAERQALALMDHPNIARVLDAGATAAGRPYFVMNLVKGAPITQYCDEHRLTPRQRLELFIPVCQAVQHAHQKGIIHRDLKPSNVLVALYDGKPAPKVIDFGVAKAAGPQLTDKTLVTGFGMIVGSLEYMSPEQAEVNQLDIDTRSDVYSLGVLLYELLTGGPPFRRKDLQAGGLLDTLRAIRDQEPTRPSAKLSTADGLPTLAANRGTEAAKLAKLLRGELDWIVLKALEKDRCQRYETANGFARDIQRYLADEPVEACPPSAGYRLRKFARRNKGRLAVAVLVLFFLASLGGVAGWAALQHAAQWAALETDIGRDLDAARDFCRQDRLREASAVLDHAQAVAARGGAGADPGGRVARVRKDVDMASRLEAIRLTRAAAVTDEYYDWEGAALRYTEAFRDYELDLDQLEPHQVGARIEVSPIREQLVAALDDWLWAPSGGNRERLLAVLARADPDPWRQQLRAAFVERNLEAIRALAGEANASGQPPGAAALMGKALFDLGEFRQAVEFLRRAQQEHPGDFWLNVVLGDCLLKRGEPAQAGEAAGYFRAALALRPDSSMVLANLGQALYVQRDLPGAVAALQRATALQPDLALGHFYLGLALQAQGDLPGAIASLQRAIALKPDFAEAHFYLGKALANRSDLPGAVAAYQKAIAIRPSYTTGYLALGSAFESQGDLPGAVAAYQKAIAITPSWAPLYAALGRALEGEGDLPGAVAAYQKAIAIVPDYVKDVQPEVVRVRYYLRLRQWDKAAAEYAKADLWARPLRGETYTYACLFLMQGDGEGYDRFCQGMIQHVAQPETPWEAYILARTCATARTSPLDPARAVQWADQAVFSDRSPWALHVLGLAQYRAGQFDQALQSFTKANDKTWRYADLNWFGLALVHHRLGHPDEARQCLDRGVQWLEREGPPDPGQRGKLQPQDWLEAQLLRREAEEMLKTKPGP